MKIRHHDEAALYQLLYALRENSLGRRTLVDETGMTEMTVRTHLNKLRAAGLVTMEKSGTELTERAKEIASPLFRCVQQQRELKLSELWWEGKNASAHLRDCKDSVRRSLYLRDAAIRAGATVAIFLIRDSKGWIFSEDSSRLSEQNPHDSELLEREFEAGRDDVLIISFGRTLREARAGLWSVIAEMIPLSLNSKKGA